MKLINIMPLCTALIFTACTAEPIPDISELPQTMQTAASSEITLSEAIVETTVEITVIETTAPPKSEAEILLESMTTEQKAGQLFIVCPEDLLTAVGAGNVGGVKSFDENLTAALTEYPVGGVVLFARNITSPEQLQTLTSDFKSAAEIPLFIAVDEEGGTVARLANSAGFDLPKYKNAASVGESGSYDSGYEMGSEIGGYLAKYGFNLDFAPVADVNTNPANPIIGKRAFSSDPQTAALMVRAFSDGLTSKGVISTFKHFPGHGDTAEDSHKKIAVSYKSKEELYSCEWLPFMEAGENDMVMVGHIALPNVTGDMTPAAMSREIVTDILKDEIGFKGIIITDSLAMGAVQLPSDEAAVAALTAGCDVLLMPEDFAAAYNAVISAIQNGELTEEELDSKVLHILEFKYSHGLLNNP